MEQVLTRQQGELVALERRLVLRVRDALTQADGTRADVERLAALINEMDELFLLVVVGEYNSGKSTFINALLGDEVFAMGDLPTTRAISILRYAREHLAPWQRVRRIEFAELPKTISGKIRRVELRGREDDLASGDSEARPENEWRDDQFPQLRSGA